MFMQRLAGQFEPEAGAGAGSRIEADPPIHMLDQLLADGQAKPRAALLAGVGGIGLSELAENPCAKVVLDTRTLVA